MFPLPTIDPYVVIVDRVETQPSVTYQNLSTGAAWVVRGTCNQCGLCAIGAVGDWYAWDGPPGTPYANRDLRVPGRLDEPVGPGFTEGMAEMAAQTPTATVTGCSLVIEA